MVSASDAVVHPKSVVRGQGVAHRDFHVAGEAVLAVGAVRLQQQSVPKRLDRIALAGKAAVQVVAAVVGLQLVRPAVQGEGRALDAVGVPAHKGAAVGGGVQLVFLDGVVAQHHVHRAAPRRDDDVLDDGPIVQHADRQAAGIGQNILVDRVPAAGEPEKFAFDLGHDCLPPSAGTSPTGRAGQYGPDAKNDPFLYDYITISGALQGNILYPEYNFSGYIW